VSTQAPSAARQAMRTVWSPKNVLVAVDFGEASARAVGVAGIIASTFGARLIAVHAERFDPPPYFTLEQIARLEAERRAGQAVVTAHLVQFALKETSYPITVAISDEPPVDAILHAAANAELIVIGTHGRRGPGRWWLGSVAERVVRAATVPVLVTRAGTPPRDLFERIAIVGDDAGDASAGRTMANQLAEVFSGHVVHAGPAAHCQPELMAQASLVVMETSGGHPAWAMSDSVAKILGSCQRPVLFIPKVK